MSEPPTTPEYLELDPEMAATLLSTTITIAVSLCQVMGDTAHEARARLDVEIWKVIEEIKANGGPVVGAPGWQA